MNNVLPFTADTSGMEKRLIFPTKTHNGTFLYVLGEESDHLTKTASEYHPEIAAYINNPKSTPGKTQVLLTALGSGEYWGPNVNGDYFPEADLAHPGGEYGYKTFETTAKVYKHHQNKYGQDPHFGEVVLAVYNPKYRRVELIVTVDNTTGRDIVKRIEMGDYPEWSMGCRVKFDICSVCGNKAKTRKFYCNHLKYYMGRIDPETGKQVYAINPKPRFFDISYVLIGADKTAKTLMKVAFHLGAKNGGVVGSAELAEKMAAEKKADMEKEVPATDPKDGPNSSSAVLEAMTELQSRERAIDKKVLNTLADKFPVEKILSTMMMLGMAPKPEETQRLVIVAKAGSQGRALADMLESKGICFDPAEELKVPSSACKMISHRNFEPSLASCLGPIMNERSCYNPFIGRRLVVMLKDMPEPATRPLKFVKIGKVLTDSDFNKKEEQPSFMSAAKYMALAALLHQAFGKKAPVENLSGLDKLLATHPGMMAALGIGGAAVMNQLLKPGSKGEVANKDFQMMPEIPPMENGTFKFAFKNIGNQSKKLLGGTAGAYLLSSGLQRRAETDPEYREGGFKKFLRKNPDIVSGLVAFDAMAGLSGGGSTGLFRKSKSMVNPILKRFTKMAHEQNSTLEKKASEKRDGSGYNMLSSTLVWPLAFGRAGAPARVIGGLIDQSLLKGISGALNSSKKNKPKPTIGG